MLNWRAWSPSKGATAPQLPPIVVLWELRWSCQIFGFFKGGQKPGFLCEIS